MTHLETLTSVHSQSLELANSLQDLEEFHWHFQTYGRQRLYLQGLHHSGPGQRPFEP